MIRIADIGIPQKIIKNYKACFETTLKWVARKIPERSALSYKQSVGRLLVLAGSKGLTGAAAMTCQAAMRAGAGIVTLVCPEKLNEIFEIKLTESMTFPVEQTESGSLHINSFKNILNESGSYDALAIGPGLSKNPSTVMLVREVLKNINIPTVLDADGLRALASPMEIKEEDDFFNLKNVVITPHAGEMCSILLHEKVSPDERIEINEEASKKFGVVSVLKGSSTLITLKNETFINPTGDFSLATAGTGDILTGIIGALLCQGMDRLSAAVCGVYIHGLASDLISKKTGKTAMIATDLLKGLQKVFLEIEKLKY
jgi:NAD(P)H-hydrate epimerase